MTPLVQALWISRSSSTDNIIKILLEAGANVEAMDKNGRTALFFASGSASYHQYTPSATKMLLEAGTQINNKVWEVLPQELKDKYEAQRNWQDGPARRWH
jgi:hypothetical protein